METMGAVSARRWRAPLADLGLLLAIAAAVPIVVAVVVFVAPGWPGVLLGTGGVAAIVVLVGRKALRAKVTLRLGSTTGLALVIGCGVTLAFMIGSCTRPTQPWAPFAAMGVVYFGLGMFSLEGRFLWGLPLAVGLAFAAFLALALTLPSTPTLCD